MLYKVFNIKSDVVMFETKDKEHADDVAWELNSNSSWNFYKVVEFKEQNINKKEFKTLLVDGDLARFKLEQALNDGWIIVQTNETNKFIIYVLKKEI